MRYAKLFILAAVALPLFTSCSDDDDVNTRECTIGFESATVEINEAASGYVNVPIVLSGRRNGPVRVTIEAAPYGDNPAIEGEHYMITDKTLNINADTLSTGEMNVELKVINDDEVNDNRQFTLTIKSAEGAEVTTQTTTVSIVDDDKDPYFGFFGTWYLNGTTTGSTGLPVNASMPVTVSGVTDTSDPAYNRKLTVETSSILSGIPMSFNMEFNIDKSDPSNMTGTIGIPYGQTVVSGVTTGDPVTGAAMTVDVSLVGLGATGYIDNTGILKSDTWTIGSDGVLPTEVTFNQTTRILFGFNYVNTSVPEASGYYNFANYYGLSLTREPLY